jgi:hypothetical protein
MNQVKGDDRTHQQDEEYGHPAHQGEEDLR